MFGAIKRKVVHHFTMPLHQDLEKARLISGQAAMISSKNFRGEFKYLWDAEVKIFSQWGEDGIINYLCDVLDIVRPNMIELGAGNFDECNSRYLAENRNAGVIAVDSREDLVANVKSLDVYWKNHIFAVCDWITPESISRLLTFGKDNLGTLNILSLDIDGNDYWVLEQQNLEEFEILVVEYNALFGSRFPVTVPRNDEFQRKEAHFSHLYWGVSLRAWIHLFEKSGFVFIGSNRANCNAFFIHEAKVSKLHFNISDDFSIFTDSRVRESRDEAGQLNYLSGDDRLRAIENLPLINTVDKTELTVRDLLHIK
jgi:hypothetical protein